MKSTKPSEYDEFLAFKTLTGFTPPTGPGRCQWCGFHVKTMDHRGGCPQEENK